MVARGRLLSTKEALEWPKAIAEDDSSPGRSVRPERLLNLRGPDPGEALNRYEAIIRETRLFYFNCNNANKQKDANLLA